MMKSKHEEGQVVAEYALIFALVVFLVVVGSAFFTEVQQQMRNARDTGIRLMIDR